MKEKIMTKQSELPWLTEARKHIGLAEIPGKQHNPTITNWLIKLKAWWRDDETPWCGVFVAHCLRSANRAIPKHWYRAKEYANYGTRLSKPAYGCIAVMSRQGGGHVGFVVGEVSKGGDLLILGGNQGNKVSIARFPRSRITAYVWPELGNGVKSRPTDRRYALPLGVAARSASEA